MANPMAATAAIVTFADFLADFFMVTVNLISA
jgi:hypothetical protein